MFLAEIIVEIGLIVMPSQCEIGMCLASTYKTRALLFIKDDEGLESSIISDTGILDCEDQRSEF
jgi:hypothetical protein